MSNAAPTVSSQTTSSSNIQTITNTNTPPIWKWDAQATANFIKTQSKAEQDSLRKNFLRAFVAVLQAQKKGDLNVNASNNVATNADASSNNINTTNASEIISDGVRSSADVVSSANEVTIKQEVVDPYRILPTSMLPAIGNLPAGSIFIKIQLGGLINGVSGVVGGVTEPYVTNLADCKRMWKAEHNSSTELLKQLQEWYEYSNRLKAGMVAKVGQDKIEEMPMQIVEMMCGKDMDIDAIENLRSRVYNTVVLGQGTNASAKMQELEGTGNDIVLAKPASTSKVEQYHKCNQCSNVDQGDFVLDKKNGDVICGNCGMVVMESLMHEGSQYRNFEGEADRNHHGDLANPLYSDAHNMSTSLSMGNDNQIGDTMAKKLGTILKNAHTYTEMNISQFGAKEKKTRIGYKDKQKKDAFMQMQHVGSALNLHEQIIQYAKELFAGFRDDRELLQSYKGILAACLLESFDKFSKEGKQMLKQKIDNKQQGNQSVRSNWRDNLHDNAASKFEASSKIAFVENESTQKPVSEWNLELVRSWLTTTSHKIASELSGGDEMEGKLVEFSLKLVEYLQNELNSNDKQVKSRSGAVATPRVNDMAKLQIKWQKLDTHNGGKTKTAGQLLILKSVKKLIQITADEKSSIAINKELKSLLAQQNNKKRKASNAEVEEKRLAQMKRKPWLQTKITT